MAEQLLKPMDAAERLKVKRTKFYDIRPRLIAMGLKTVRVGKQVKYLESSLDALIKRCAETGQTLG
jgi:sugar-specific transcriptional regulator TrmB